MQDTNLDTNSSWPCTIFLVYPAWRYKQIEINKVYVLLGNENCFPQYIYVQHYAKINQCSTGNIRLYMARQWFTPNKYRYERLDISQTIWHSPLNQRDTRKNEMLRQHDTKACFTQYSITNPHLGVILQDLRPGTQPCMRFPSQPAGNIVYIFWKDRLMGRWN